MKRLTIRLVLRLFLTPLLSTAAHADDSMYWLTACDKVTMDAVPSWAEECKRHGVPQRADAVPACPDGQSRVVDAEGPYCVDMRRPQPGGYPVNVDQGSIEAWRRSRAQ